MNRYYDVIIPVYNGLDFVQHCYNSVKTHTQAQHRIIIVDDASTEASLLSFYKSIENDSQTTILKLKTNGGFVRTANHGIRYSNRNVVLLNSDTVVTCNWLDKLDAALYSAPDVGTATPWTNNGTICSIPQFCKDNPLPTGVDAEDLNKFAELASPGNYPRIPTGVGFCMAIKREVIQTIGFLDENKFGRGYGEENDFCMRAWKCGYRHVLDDRTFILHLGSMTFTDEKRITYIENNLKIVDSDHPTYLPMVAEFIARDPLKENRERIQRLIEHKQGHHHILYFLHNDPFGDFGNPPGGTEYHALQLAEMLNKNGKLIPYFLISSGTSLIFYHQEMGKWKKNVTILPEKIDISARFNPFYADRLAEILSIYHIEIVHIQHFIHHPSDWSALLKDWHGLLYISLHDYYAICPSFNLLDFNGQYCNGGSTDRCNGCLHKNKLVSLDVELEPWRLQHSSNFDRAQKIFLPSNHARNLISQFFANHASKFHVIAHGIPTRNLPARNNLTIPRSLTRIAFLGGLSKAKGSDLIRATIMADTDHAFHWHTIGNIGDEDLAKQSSENITHVGRYTQDQLCTILDELQIDIVVLTSIWPETYSYTLSEAWRAGIPVVVGPLGAPAERVRTFQGGWVLDENTPESLLKQLTFLSAHFPEYLEKLHNVAHTAVVTTDQMANEYLENYLTDIKQCHFPSTTATPIKSSALEKFRSAFDFYDKRHLDDQNHLDNLTQALSATQDDFKLSEIHIKNLESQILANQEQLQLCRNHVVNIESSLFGITIALQETQEQLKSTLNSKSWRYTQKLRDYHTAIRRVFGGTRDH